MRVEVSAVARAPVDDVWSWWTDYGNEGDVSKVGHGIGQSVRKVKERSAKRVVLEEDLPLPLGRKVEVQEHVVDIHEGRWLHERTTDGPLRYESKWFFEALPGGETTRITRVLDVPGRAWEFIGPVAEPVARKWALTDLRFHVDEFEKERGKR